MKNLFLLTILIFTINFTFAQSPEKMSYQAVIRSSSNQLITNSQIGMRISILQGSSSGVEVYQETQTPSTNANGLVSIEIGPLSTIDWANGPYFIKTETDPLGGIAYTITGTSQLLSVPYALYAANSPAGAQGPQGIQGPIGPQGVQGIQGPIGPQGIAGVGLNNQGTWVSGTSYNPNDYVFAPSSGNPLVNSMFIVQADASFVSNTNPADDLANWVEFEAPSGPQGIQGTQGPAGQDGASGPQGVQGNDGPMGPQGLQGIQGPAGQDGSFGITGTQNQTLFHDGTNWLATSNLNNDGTNVGVGTATPNATLHVKSNTDATPFIIQANAVQSNTNPLLRFQDSNGNEVSRIHSDDSTNVFIGLKSGNANTGSLYNTALGYKTFLNQTTGYENTALGAQALLNNTIGNSNMASGVNALYSNTSGSFNLAAGHNSLFSNTTGSWNTANGQAALFSNISGNNNSAHGQFSLYSNTTGSENTAIGTKSMTANTIGNYNTSMGSSSLFSNTTGFENSAMGYFALYSNTMGSDNTANGAYALYNNTEGGGNTANGVYSLFSNVSGIDNVAIGLESLYSNTSGSYNVANGIASLKYNTIGYDNTAIGNVSLFNNTIGFENVAIGSYSLTGNLTGSGNTASGSYSLAYNTSGGENTAYGLDALRNNQTGDCNVGMGVNSLNQNIIGSYNTALGWYAGNNCVDLTNTISIGSGASASASNQAIIGDLNITSIGGFANWTNVSDVRFKKDITESIPGLDFILKLRPVTYHLDMDAIAKFNKIPDSLRNKKSETEKGAILQSGFIAQEVENVAKKVGFDFSGIDKPKNENDRYGLRYAEFVVPLVKAMQEQQKIIEEQKTSNEELLKRIEKLEKIFLELYQEK